MDKYKRNESCLHVFNMFRLLSYKIRQNVVCRCVCCDKIIGWINKKTISF